MDFTKVEYLTVFSSIIYGFVAAEYFHGWGNFLKFNYKRISYRFLIWSVFELTLLINIWWNTWVRGSKLSDHIGYFFLSLTTPIILYLISVITFPSTESTNQVDLHQYLRSRFPKIMFFFFLLMISLIINTYYFSNEKFMRIETGVLFVAALLTLNGVIFRTNRAINIIIPIAWILLLFHILFVHPSFDLSLSIYFTQIEYLVIFIAILYGYATSVFFIGWGSLIREFKFKEVHWYHIGWTIFAFILLVDMWWSAWMKTSLVVRNIGYFYASIVQPLILYFLGISLFLVLLDKKDRVRENFKLASPIIFGLFGLLMLSNILVSLIFEESELFNSKNLFRLMGLIFAIIAAFKQTRFVQILVLSSAWLVYFLHLYMDEFLFQSDL